MQTQFPLLAACVFLLLLALPVEARDEMRISRYTVDGGGTMFSTGREFELSGTIGQIDSAILTGREFEVSGGFWIPIATGDCNDDGGINVFDASGLSVCLRGPDVALPPAQCSCLDFNADLDVDLMDFAEFQRDFIGH